MIVLVGFMGAGKSTVGRLLAERLGRPFADSDAVVESRAGCEIADYFAAHGEAAFRALEERTVLDLLDGDDVVLALGGGSLGSAPVRAALAHHEVLYLRTPLAEVLRRVGDDPRRPMLRSPDVEALYAGRLHAYEAVATLVVDAARPNPKVVADDALAALAARGAGPTPPEAP